MSLVISRFLSPPNISSDEMLSTSIILGCISAWTISIVIVLRVTVTVTPCCFERQTPSILGNSFFTSHHRPFNSSTHQNKDQAPYKQNISNQKHSGQDNYKIKRNQNRSNTAPKRTIANNLCRFKSHSFSRLHTKIPIAPTSPHNVTSTGTGLVVTV